MMFPQKLKIAIWPSNPTSQYASKIIESRISKGYLHTHVHSSIIHNSQDMEATLVSISGWMDKQDVIYTYGGIFSSLKNKEIPSLAATWIPLEDFMLNERSQSHRTNAVWFYLSAVSKVVKFIETESRMVVIRDWGRGTRSYSVGTWFQFCKMKSFRNLLHNKVPTGNTAKSKTVKMVCVLLS